jgi:aspartyl-tRNA(Asn)/glutamyl-tRNA(Gln) amidotransferase subunit A
VIPFDLSATALKAAYAKGTLDPVAALESALARIESREPEVKAWAHVDAEGARAAARTMAAELKAGTPRGPLHGIPVGIKDVFHVEGMPTLANSKTMDPARRYPDSGVAAALRKAGAIILGKTTTVEFAGMGQPPESRNPWNLGHTGGGSSSGSGVAVGARMVPVAIGTQTGGSNIRPAAYNGVAGLKPTYGALSRQGSLPVAWSLDHPGLITRAAADLELVFSAIAKVRLAPVEAPARWKVGVLRGYFSERSTPDAAGSFDNALSRLAAAGFELVEIPLPPLFAAHRSIHHLIMSTEMAVFHAPRIANHRDTMTERHRLMAEAFSLVPAGYYLEALRAKRAFQGEMAALFADVDVLAMPTVPAPAPEGLESTGDASFQVPWSLTGFPTTTIPSGLAGNGLPLGLQFAGAPGADLRVIRAAMAAEAVLGPLTLPD